MRKAPHAGAELIGFDRARAKKLTPEERQAIAQKGGEARNRKLTPAQRRKIAEKASKASKIARARRAGAKPRTG